MDAAREHFGTAWDAIAQHVNNVMLKVFGVEDAWGKLVAFVQSSVTGIISYISNIVKAIQGVIDAVRLGGYQFTLLFEDGSGALLDLAEAFGMPVEAAQEFLANIYSIIDRFRDAFTNARQWIFDLFTKTDWAQLGLHIIYGIVNGLLGGIPALIAAAWDAAQAALRAIMDALDIHSPSGAFEKLGMFAGQGFQLGLAKAMSAEDIGRTMARPVNQLSNSNQQSLVMNLASGVSIQQVRGMIAENNEELMNTFISFLEKS
jgi:hypothetical protein